MKFLSKYFFAAICMLCLSRPALGQSDVSNTSKDTVWLSNLQGLAPLNEEGCYILNGNLGFNQTITRNQLSGLVANIHGNLNYEYQYRSLIDTPFQQEDFQQHLVRGQIKASLFGSVPTNIGFTVKINNSPYFRNILEVNTGFDYTSFRKQLEGRITGIAKAQLEKDLGIPELEASYAKANYDANYWRTSSSDPLALAFNHQIARELAGRIVEKLRLPDTSIRRNNAEILLTNFLLGKQKVPDVRTALADVSGKLQDTVSRVYDEFEPDVKRFKQFDGESSSQAIEAKKYYAALQSARKKVADSLSILRSRLTAAGSRKELDSVLSLTGIAKDSISKLQRNLFRLQSCQIGRSNVEYTDLTIKNISITGISGSANLGRYIAVAAGFLDYQYRDFAIRKVKLPRQPAVMGRFGFSGHGDRGLFLTAYTARQEINSPSGNSQRVKFGLSGYSLQYIYALDKENTITAEIAKSTSPIYRPSPDHQAGGTLISFSDRNNEAYFLSYKGSIPATRTRIIAYYKRQGVDFQSLSGYSSNAVQNAYNISVIQPAFKDALSIKAGIRKNEFKYPWLQNVSSNSTFKTAQLSFQKRYWPTLTAGYYPATQLVILPDKEPAEFIFHTLTGSGSYQYKLAGSSNTMLGMYSRFFNGASDSVFAYRNATSWSIRHITWLRSFSYQLAYTSLIQRILKMATAEVSAGWQKHGFQLSAAARLSRTNQDMYYFSNSCQIGLPLKKLGHIALVYDKSFLPMWQQSAFVPIINGKIIYIKTF